MVSTNIRAKYISRNTNIHTLKKESQNDKTTK